jgi:hypothetical protein
MSNRAERRAAERAALKSSRRAQTQASAAPEVKTTSQKMQDLEDLIAATPGLAAQRDENPSQTTQTTHASEAQINANRENAKKSTGPTSEAGKAKVSENRRTHGLLGRFKLLPFEDVRDYFDLVESVHEEFSPQTDDEFRLANAMIQHYWLIQRALNLQEDTLMASYFPDQQLDQKKLALFMRYQAQHERSYAKARKELKTVQAERAKKQNGFESQTAKQAALEAKTRLANAHAQRIEIDTECKKVMEIPIPGTTRLSFEQLTKACAEAIATLAMKERCESANS